MTVSIYADGSSHARGGKPGGWAFVITSDDAVLVAGYGGDPSTSNNKMELTAAIKGLETLDQLVLDDTIRGSMLFRGQIIELVSDSQYTLGMASGKMFPSVDKDGIVKNGELVDRLRYLAERLLTKDSEGRPRTRWVRGHNGDYFNERVDSLAKRGKREATVDVTTRTQ